MGEWCAYAGAMVRLRGAAVAPASMPPPVGTRMVKAIRSLLPLKSKCAYLMMCSANKQATKTSNLLTQ